MNLFLLGAVATASLAAGLFFLRFWRETKDRLFMAFSISFFMEGINRTALALSRSPQEGAPFFYVVRLLAYLLILLAVADKNRAARTPKPTDPSSRPTGAPRGEDAR